MPYSWANQNKPKVPCVGDRKGPDGNCSCGKLMAQFKRPSHQCKCGCGGMCDNGDKFRDHCARRLRGGDELKERRKHTQGRTGQTHAAAAPRPTRKRPHPEAKSRGDPKKIQSLKADDDIRDIRGGDSVDGVTAGIIDQHRHHLRTCDCPATGSGPLEFGRTLARELLIGVRDVLAGRRPSLLFTLTDMEDMRVLREVAIVEVTLLPDGRLSYHTRFHRGGRGTVAWTVGITQQERADYHAELRAVAAAGHRILHYGGREPAECERAGVECCDVLRALRFLFGSQGGGVYTDGTEWSWSASFISWLYHMAYTHAAPRDCMDVAFFLVQLLVALLEEPGMRASL